MRQSGTVSELALRHFPSGTVRVVDRPGGRFVKRVPARRWVGRAIDGFWHRCHGGVVTVSRWIDHDEPQLVVSQGPRVAVWTPKAVAEWKGVGPVSVLRISGLTEGDFRMRELAPLARLIPADKRDWGVDPDFLHWLRGVWDDPSHFLAT